ncbi:MAG: c-type cytochrome [Betaproteobacteria bacterium]|nr:c-type cytochrome [Betaproteobacteria bacterium]
MNPNRFRSAASLRLTLAGLVLVTAGAGLAMKSSWSDDTADSVIFHGNGKAPGCVVCHGAHGEGGGNGAFPRIGGQPAAYLEAQLRAIRDGQRANAVMAPSVAGLDDDRLRAIAQYFSRQEVGTYPPAPEASQARTSRGYRLVMFGDWDHGVPACADCHGPALNGVAPAIPGLTGQTAGYLSAQLDAYRNGQRPANALGLMPRVARGLSPDDITAVSTYIATLRPGGVMEAPAAPEAASWKPRAQSPEDFTPPPDTAIPEGPYGDMIRLGESIFNDTPTGASKYVRNDLSCRNCHLDRGRLASSSPMWAAYVHYPEYRKKNRLVNTMQMRIQGCFRYSENGIVPPSDSPEITALVTYFHWLSTGLPVGIKPPASGYRRLPPPTGTPDRGRGAVVYAANCAMCHGEDGQGRVAGGRVVFPPLWGPRSFNWGAGMHQVDMAAAFIRANMPYGAGGTLSEQDAWDVAAYVNSHDRPQDPRFVDDVETTREKFHAKHRFGYYGRDVEGVTLGTPAH